MHKHILVPLDESPFSERSISVACQIAAKFDSEITLCHVLSLDEHIFAESATLYLDLKTIAQDEATRYLQTHQQELRAEGFATHINLIDWGTPADGVIGLANNGLYDLIVMTTHGRTGLRRFVLGSVAEKVVRHVDIPVLLIHGKTDEWIDSSPPVHLNGNSSVQNDFDLLGDTHNKMRIHYQDKVVSMRQFFDEITQSKSEEESIRWMTQLGQKLGQAVIATNDYTPRPTQAKLALRCILRSFDLPFSASDAADGRQYNIAKIDLEKQEMSLFELMMTSTFSTIMPDLATKSSINYKDRNGVIVLEI